MCVKEYVYKEFILTIAVVTVKLYVRAFMNLSTL